MMKVENLTNAFSPKVAVNRVSFSVERGEVLGFLGPNGAGKSTSMRMITGFIPPTEGKVTVGGYDMVENPIPAKRRSEERRVAREWRTRACAREWTGARHQN